MVGEGEVEGEWVDQIAGLEGVKAAMVMVGPPGGETRIELTKFHTPAAVGGGARNEANLLASGTSL